jgi:hypothetical protein
MSVLDMEQSERQEFMPQSYASTFDVTSSRMLQLREESSELSQENRPLTSEAFKTRVTLPSLYTSEVFPAKIIGIGEFNRPWLPPEAIRLLSKLRMQKQLSPSELTNLMDIIARRTIDHFKLTQGKFVAITLSGKIVELANTKLELLKKIQGVSYPEEVFVWKVGCDSFSGRL